MKISILLSSTLDSSRFFVPEAYPSCFVISRQELKRLDVFKETDEIRRTLEDNDDEDQEEIISDLKMQIDKYKNDLELTKDEITQLKHGKNALTQEIARLKTVLDASNVDDDDDEYTNGVIEEFKLTIIERDQEIEVLKKQLDEQNAHNAKLKARSYMIGEKVKYSIARVIKKTMRAKTIQTFHSTDPET